MLRVPDWHSGRPPSLRSYLEGSSRGACVRPSSTIPLVTRWPSIQWSMAQEHLTESACLDTTLLVLMGVSQGTYLGKKVVSSWARRVCHRS